MKNIAPKFLLIAASFLLFTVCNARTITPPAFFAISAGLGSESVQNARWELSGGLSANAIWNRDLFGMRAVVSQEVVTDRTALGTREYALYYAKYFLSHNTTAFATLGAGFSYVRYDVYGARYFPDNAAGEYHYLNQESTCGLALDAQIGKNIGRYFSIGIHGFASVHTVKTTAGALLSFRIGLLDTRLNNELRQTPGAN